MKETSVIPLPYCLKVQGVCVPVSWKLVAATQMGGGYGPLWVGRGGAEGSQGGLRSRGQDN